MSLLLEIFQCPNVRSCLENRDSDHPCSRIVQEQGCTSAKDHMMPEPWMGNLKKAPILFLGPNPKLGTGYEYPSWDDPNDQIEDFFNNHFGNGLKEWTKDGVRYITADGKDHANKYWAATRRLALELLETGDAIAGITYALSEVVHCASVSENKALADAVNECSALYLSRVVAESGAKVVVCLGRVAERTVRQIFTLPDEVKVHGPVDVGGLRRWFGFLPHPSAWPPLRCSFEGNLSPEELKQLRDCLK